MTILTRWVKPSGVELMVNDEEASVEKARELGWIPHSETEAGIAEARAVVEKADAAKSKSTSMKTETRKTA